MSEKSNQDKRSIFISDSNNDYLKKLITIERAGITVDHLYNILEIEHGLHLSEVIFKEWAIARLKEIIDEWEVEHGNSLALIFENESQRLMLEELNKKLVKARINLEKDINMAANVQRSFLHNSPPFTKNFDIAFHFQPFLSVSGDYYDFYINDNNELNGLLLVDVSGHGIASSLLTVFTKPIFYKVFRDNLDIPVHHVLSKINCQLIEEINETENYLTAVMLRFNGNMVEYVNAAHPDIMHVKASSGECVRVRPEGRAIQGHVLGVGSIKYAYEPYEFKMEKGDVLVIYSDCLIESINSDGAAFGEPRVVETLKKASEMKTAKGILSRLTSNFFKFTGSNPLDDDFTIIVIKKK